MPHSTISTRSTLCARASVVGMSTRKASGSNLSKSSIARCLLFGGRDEPRHYERLLGQLAALMPDLQRPRTGFDLPVVVQRVASVAGRPHHRARIELRAGEGLGAVRVGDALAREPGDELQGDD